MEFDLSGKKAVVTGAGAGIGLAVVQALASAGADVLGGARTVTPELRAATPFTYEVDLITEQGPQQLIKHALAEFGGIDILVNQHHFSRAGEDPVVDQSGDSEASRSDAGRVRRDGAQDGWAVHRADDRA